MVRQSLGFSNKISERGVIIPIYPDIYDPALKELAELGLVFKEEITKVQIENPD